ncbi:hypothetical protein HKW98_02415 [Stutzerimonas urumqiensis]|uniref:hypothetical protein n=1 Tax=Stutzerimonas urumqiensis TaxID=638269 RepID=UPI003BA95E75
MSWRRSTFLLPLLIALLSGAGLIVALFGDGAWDMLSWLGLGIPAVLGCWPLLLGGKRSRQPTAAARRTE